MRPWTWPICGFLHKSGVFCDCIGANFFSISHLLLVLVTADDFTCSTRTMIVMAWVIRKSINWDRCCGEVDEPVNSGWSIQSVRLLAAQELVILAETGAWSRPVNWSWSYSSKNNILHWRTGCKKLSPCWSGGSRSHQSSCQYRSPWESLLKLCNLALWVRIILVRQCFGVVILREFGVFEDAWLSGFYELL